MSVCSRHAHSPLDDARTATRQTASDRAKTKATFHKKAPFGAFLIQFSTGIALALRGRAAAVFARTCIDFDFVANRTKQRHRKLKAGIDLGGFHDLA